MMDTVMLEYIALGTLIFTAASLLFGAIAILNIPYKIAVDRNHPHQDAIYFAGWVSLFTLHTIWPLLWIWSAAFRDNPVPKFIRINEETAINDKPVLDEVEPEVGETEVGETEPEEDDTSQWEDITDSVSLLGHRYEVLDDRIDRIENAIMAAGKAA